MDSVSEARLQLVCPTLADKIHQMADILALDNPPIHFRVTQGLRTWQEQGMLYAQGRSTPGKIVTNAGPGDSWHNFGCGVDVAPFLSDTNVIDWNIEHPIWQRMIAVGVSLGLTTGSTFRTFPDYPHFQLTGSWPESPNAEVRSVFHEAGMQQLWREGGLIT